MEMRAENRCRWSGAGRAGLLGGLLWGLAACSGDAARQDPWAGDGHPDAAAAVDTPPASDLDAGFGGDLAAGVEVTSAGPENTFDHPSSLGGQRRTAAERIASSGADVPTAYRARVHACRKVRYRTLGRVLQRLGVDLQATAPGSAGVTWRESDQSLGFANYAARVAETTEHTVASASRMFDLLVQAAPEVIANLPERAECRVGGEPTLLFDAAGGCTANGVACLLGTLPTADHLTLCRDTVRRASSRAVGERLAVATLLAASMTCE